MTVFNEDPESDAVLQKIYAHFESVPGLRLSTCIF